MKNKCSLLLLIMIAVPLLVAQARLNDADTNSVINQISGYKQWYCVNPGSKRTIYLDARDCNIADDDPENQILADKLSNAGINLHKNNYIKTYVNEIGKAAMLSQQIKIYPIGSIIVKEKLPRQFSPDAELLTVMIKREAGFNPNNGDWEYLVLDGTATKVEAIGKLKNCQSCHQLAKDRDFVFYKYINFNSNWIRQ